MAEINEMGRNSLERGNDSDGDDSEHPNPEVLGDVGGSVVAGGEVSADKNDQKADESLDAKPVPTKSKRVASEKMKAALQRARQAKAEKREKLSQKLSSHTQQFFFDIV